MRSRIAQLRTLAPIAVIIALLVGGVPILLQLGTAPARATPTPRLPTTVRSVRNRHRDRLMYVPIPGAQPGKWHTVFADSFGGRGGPGKNWDVVTGANIGAIPYGVGNVQLNGRGQLVIAEHHTVSGWSSGYVESTRSFEPAPGQSLLIQSTLTMPIGRSLWPAFWALASSARASSADEPAAGEVDIAESINVARWVAQILHCGPGKWIGPCGGTRSSRYTDLAGTASRREMHTYSWLWANHGPSSYVALYIDGQLNLRLTEARIGAHYWHLAFDHPYFILYDLAVGGWAQAVSRSTPRYAAMVVDSVRVLTS